MAIDNKEKVLNVPNLRFPEFTGEWKLHATTDYFEFKNGLNPEAKRFGLGTKFISVMDILNNRYITYDKVIASVLPKDDDLKEFGVNYGDILFQRSSETLEDVGRANVYLDDKTALFGGFVIRGKKIGNYNPLFFRYLLSSPNARKSIIVKGAGAQHFNISQDGLSKVLLNVPSIQEQEKISQFINYIDERIDTQSKIIEDLKKLKVAIRDRELNSIRKHYGLNMQISEILDYEQPSKYIVTETEYLNNKEFTPVLTANKAFILGYTDEPFNIYDKGECIILDDFTLDCKLVNFAFKVKSSAIKILTPKNNIMLRYVYEYLNFLNLETTEHKRHYISEIEPMLIAYPDSNESVISFCDLMDKFDKKIEYENKYLQSLLSQKNYLLSNMFI